MTNGTHSGNTAGNDGVQIRGSIPAIITPMLEDGSLDLPAFRKLIDWHIAEGTNALVVVGTSGESATLSVEEHVLMVKTAVEHTAGRIPVIAGSGGNSTTEAIELTREAKEVGANATLQVVPYYNKPTQEGIYRHFVKIAETVDLPVILYNVPGRTVADMSNETILRCAQVPGIIGVKEATGNIDRAAHLIKSAPAHFGIYSGDDPTAIALMLPPWIASITCLEVNAEAYPSFSSLNSVSSILRETSDTSTNVRSTLSAACAGAANVIQTASSQKGARIAGVPRWPPHLAGPPWKVNPISVATGSPKRSDASRRPRSGRSYSWGAPG